jgi:hypothetical protein
MGGVNYSLPVLLQAPAVDGDLSRLRYLIDRLPLYVNRIEASIRNDDRAQLGSLAHDGKGLYTELGRADEIFARIYSVALSATSSEMDALVQALRSEAARLGEALDHSGDSPTR